MIIRTVFEMSGQFLNCPDSFWIVRTDFRFSGQFLNCWTVFELSVQFLSRSESAGLSRQVLDCPDSFYFVRTVFELFFNREGSF